MFNLEGLHVSLENTTAKWKKKKEIRDVEVNAVAKQLNNCTFGSSNIKSASAWFMISGRTCWRRHGTRPSASNVRRLLAKSAKNENKNFENSSLTHCHANLTKVLIVAIRNTVARNKWQKRTGMEGSLAMTIRKRCCKTSITYLLSCNQDNT